MVNPDMTKLNNSLVKACDFHGDTRGLQFFCIRFYLKVRFLDLLAVIPDRMNLEYCRSIYEKLLDDAALLNSVGIIFA
jgi:hypothetical protein